MTAFNFTSSPIYEQSSPPHGFQENSKTPQAVESSESSVPDFAIVVGSDPQTTVFHTLASLVEEEKPGLVDMDFKKGGLVNLPKTAPSTVRALLKWLHGELDFTEISIFELDLLLKLASELGTEDLLTDFDEFLDQELAFWSDESGSKSVCFTRKNKSGDFFPLFLLAVKYGLGVVEDLEGFFVHSDQETYASSLPAIQTFDREVAARIQTKRNGLAMGSMAKRVKDAERRMDKAAREILGARKEAEVGKKRVRESMEYLDEVQTAGRYPDGEELRKRLRGGCDPATC